MRIRKAARFSFAAAAMLAAVGCHAAPDTGKAEAPAGQAHTEPVTLTAADGVKVYGTWYRAEHPKALILLFHQAGSSSGEYATIAPKLVAMGYSAFAIDQRAGDGMFGENRTAKALGHDAGYLDAKADLEAALAWAKDRKLPVLLWGSSYSAALVFLVAAEHPGEVAGLLAFSPGEYLGSDTMVKAAAAKLRVPVFVTSAKSPEEIAAARAIAEAVRVAGTTLFVPQEGGVHGSSTLIPARDPAGAEENWKAVQAFLRRVVP
ncbi:MULTISPECIES: alpha/beta hydrolase [Sphingomonas]|nr:MULTISPECIES: alpha/beta hydrolase [Sphingomonas]